MIDLDELIEKYIVAAIKHGESIESGDSKVANNSYKDLKSIYLAIDKCGKENAEKFYQQLIQSENDYVSSWASAHCLGMSILTKESKETLKRITKKGRTSMIKFNAEMTLDVWEEQGYLKF